MNEWIPTNEGRRPEASHNPRHSVWVRVLVVWCHLSYEMDGAMTFSDGAWVLTNFPPGYGGPAVTTRGENEQRPQVRYWRPIPTR